MAQPEASSLLTRGTLGFEPFKLRSLGTRSGKFLRCVESSSALGACDTTVFPLLANRPASLAFPLSVVFYDLFWVRRMCTSLLYDNICTRGRGEGVEHEW
uniref:Uncharacterized protein n=1 Tax=Pseudictyota dubia TaxID=2749911 RepID=A0A7R9VPR6_9STRA|mmetsp:Transcript_19681/g.36990  ORF Transcript_19681/g.36990 Transcript_19681/m.36990 type:complete len:100 (+) Transcript_19681:270-569(+)